MAQQFTGMILNNGKRLSLTTIKDDWIENWHESGVSQATMGVSKGSGMCNINNKNL